MLNIDASFVHCTYFLKGNEVGHIEKIGDIIITSGKLCACDPLYLEDKNRTQEMNIIVPKGKYPVLYDTEEELINIIFNPKSNIFEWKDIEFNRKEYPRFVEVDSAEYGFVDKDGIIAIAKNVKNGIYKKGYYDDSAKVKVQIGSHPKSLEMKINKSKNNYLVNTTRYGNGEYTLHAGYSFSDKLLCISGELIRSYLSLNLLLKEMFKNEKKLGY